MKRKEDKADKKDLEKVWTTKKWIREKVNINSAASWASE